MPKAVISTKSGATITIEGSQDEVADVLRRFEGGPVDGSRLRARRSNRSEATMRPTPAVLLADLIDEGFFSEPRELGTIRGALQTRGHFYPATTLSPLMLRLVRKKELRRIREGKHWTYVR